MSESILASTGLLEQLLHAPVGEAAVDEDLLLSVGGHGACAAPEGGGGAGLQPQLGEQLLGEVLGGVVLVQVGLPPESLHIAQRARVEHLPTRAGTEAGLELRTLYLGFLPCNIIYLQGAFKSY